MRCVGFPDRLNAIKCKFGALQRVSYIHAKPKERSQHISTQGRKNISCCNSKLHHTTNTDDIKIELLKYDNNTRVIYKIIQSEVFIRSTKMFFVKPFVKDQTTNSTKEYPTITRCQQYGDIKEKCTNIAIP